MDAREILQGDISCVQNSRILSPVYFRLLNSYSLINFVTTSTTCKFQIPRQRKTLQGAIIFNIQPFGCSDIKRLVFPILSRSHLPSASRKGHLRIVLHILRGRTLRFWGFQLLFKGLFVKAPRVPSLELEAKVKQTDV